MKKTLFITLIDGEVITRDLSKEASGLPVGTPANHEHYANLCMFISVNGMPRSADKMNMDYVPPSQIKSVVIKFESTLTIN